jgi:hypothetical protein
VSGSVSDRRRASGAPCERRSCAAAASTCCGREAQPAVNSGQHKHGGAGGLESLVACSSRTAGRKAAFSRNSEMVPACAGRGAGRAVQCCRVLTCSCLRCARWHLDGPLQHRALDEVHLERDAHRAVLRARRLCKHSIAQHSTAYHSMAQHSMT